MPAPALLLALLAPLLGADGPPATTLDAPAGAKQPQAAVADDGRVYVAFGVDNAIKVAVSADGGKTFDRPVAVGEVGALSLGMRRGPRVAVAGDAVVVTAVGGKEGKGKDGDVLAWRSTDAGESWSGPTRVNGPEGAAREGLHALAAGPKGELFCAWLDLRNGQMELWGTRSTDGGASWEPDRLVYRSPDRFICQCCHPSVAFGPKGTLYVMWRNHVGSDRDMYLARSVDGGTKFGDAQKLGQGAWKIDACPMDGGAIAVGPEGHVRTVWRRQTTVFEADPSHPERPLAAGVQPTTTLGPGGAYTAWLEARPGKLMLLLPGQDHPSAVAEQANDPMLAAPTGSKGPVVLVWEDRAGDGSLRVARLDEGR